MQEESWRNHGGETMEEEALVEPFWGPTWSQVGSKLGPSRVQVGSKLEPRRVLEALWVRPRPQGSILIDFGSQHGAKLGPSWDQVGFIIAS